VSYKNRDSANIKNKGRGELGVPPNTAVYLRGKREEKPLYNWTGTT